MCGSVFWVSLLFFVCFRVEPPHKETAQKRLLCTEIVVVPFRFYLQRSLLLKEGRIATHLRNHHSLIYLCAAIGGVATWARVHWWIKYSFVVYTGDLNWLSLLYRYIKTLPLQSSVRYSDRRYCPLFELWLKNEEESIRLSDLDTGCGEIYLDVGRFI